MAQIGTTGWDTELLADRVDVYRVPRRQDASGVDRLDPAASPATPERTDVPCSIQYAGSQFLVNGQPQVLADDLISFAEDLSLRPNDRLVAKAPSVAGHVFRVAQARWEQVVPLKVYAVRCKQVT